jgi:hypothetical protein
MVSVFSHLLLKGSVLGEIKGFIGWCEALDSVDTVVLLDKGGHAIFLVRKSQISKFLWCACPLIRHPQILHHRTKRMTHLF